MLKFIYLTMIKSLNIFKKNIYEIFDHPIVDQFPHRVHNYLTLKLNNFYLNL